MKDQLRAYIQDNLLIGESHMLADSDQLLLDGYIDSLGVTRLMGFIRSEFGVVVPAQEVTVENFGSVEVMTHYVERRMAEA